MARRIVVLMLSMIVALGVLAPSAFGWANGPDLDGDGYGDDGFGTHDWVLDNAIRFAGTGGTWIDKEVALLATDDPDTLGTYSGLHLFRDEGIGRGAPAAVADLYYQAVEAYKVGDIAKASECVGVMSHYYSDVLQPFHTEYDALTEEARHDSYEQSVDAFTRYSGSSPSWAVVRRTYVPVSDVRSRLVSAAYYSRGKYPALIAALRASSSVDKGVTDSITRDVLSLASNDLADIVRTIPSGNGVSRAPAKLSGSSMSVRCPAAKGKVRASTTCLDAAGKPIEGAVVEFTWPLKAGVKKVKVYTNAAGYAYYWHTLDGLPLMKKATVGISAAAGGTKITSSTWFVPTPALGDGAAGIRTTMSNYYPDQHMSVTATTAIKDRTGEPVVGLPVTFTWSFKTGTITHRTLTDSNGVARATHDIGGAARGYRVYVRAQTQSGGFNRSSTGSFVPK